MPTPNFFIVGAPKCGTTALYRYLSRHPSIGMSKEKEPNYFAEDTVPHRSFATLEHYLSNFEAAKGKTRIGEASVMYLSSPAAPGRIYDFNPAAQIIVMVRDPVEILHALHGQNVHAGNEHILDFERAIESDEPRYWLQGHFRGKLVGGPSYRELVHLSCQIRRYLDVFGPERMHIIRYEDFAADPKSAYEEVLTFLSLASDERHDFPIVNANRRVRFLAPHRMMRYPALLKLKRKFPLLARHARSAMDACNIVEEQRAPIDPELRHRLEIEYADEKRELAALVSREQPSDKIRAEFQSR